MRLNLSLWLHLSITVAISGLPRPRVSCLQVLEIYGDDKQRARARNYVEFVTQQRIGPVHIDVTAVGRDDLTVRAACVFGLLGPQMRLDWNTSLVSASLSCIFPSTAC